MLPAAPQNRGIRIREWGIGARKSGLGNRDWRIRKWEPIADNRCGNQLSAYRLPNLLTIFQMI